ncbi:hypothetical protein GRF29_96g1786018 [Pseudopithomyces chartarum]|uniref:Phosphoglucomutase n=1 Tax=Pseudopithomyces chartarum TaxID=1892770 RepID=A0AAN6RHC7_9PLEO|nr:hypothetical protein GRF29_96g1786018 [Pseudopithomyces chartarum]
MGISPDLKELAEEWLRLDKDKSTTDQLYHLLVQGDAPTLDRLLRPRIAFGTAGLRGPMQAGFACMNSLTVIQASQGLAAYLLATEKDAKKRGVVIGRDARHNSEKFAKLAAAAFVAKGIKVWWAVQCAARPEHVSVTMDPNLRFVYTPMHGVGLPAMQQCVEDLGIASQMVVVEQQAQPDPEFPTVKFPNPEEKGALDLAIATADASSITLILASDPDADRLAVAEKVDGKWHIFSGNQLGILLASYLLSRYPDSKPREKLAMLASTVSSRMLHALAKKEGFHFTETLTGFKWLGNVARDLEKSGYDVVFAFEEALGYMIPQTVHDKDSISAAAVFLTATSHWATQGLTPYAQLQKLYQHVGYFEDANTYLVSPSPTTTTAVFTAIRALGTPHPTQLGNRKITRWRDLTVGYDSQSEDHTPDLPVDASAQMITCEMGDGARFTVRGSGTEPKIKLYIECVGSSSEEAKSGAREILGDLLREWFKPEENGLRLA